MLVAQPVRGCLQEAVSVEVPGSGCGGDRQILQVRQALAPETRKPFAASC